MLFIELWKRGNVQIVYGIPLVETIQELEEVVGYLGPFHSRIGYLSLIILNF
ncbi:hypothetical protein K469DRAFT_699542 [Zopfia rhizophila CBS 207.26]|uniref:Uncharacterized protein n=1 Tax=Zopfia rhizophila CBS 207.26 TaxID=1314779 RepID=A0A6A6EX97_9PEZI|nr:hypothetical protein K469DRAFT_699542 [Zopfia rhizophila CBS 207.26]